MKLDITKTNINKGFKDFLKDIKKDEKNTTFRHSLYSTDGNQRMTFIFETKETKSEKFLFGNFKINN